jgi:MazG family protein
MTQEAILAQVQQAQGIDKLLQVVAHLRHPEHGCPWDLKQTHSSLKRFMLEEAYEAIEAVDETEASGDPTPLKEELGDVLLQVVLHSQLAQDAGTFDFQQVCDTIAEKLIRRHPHVFGSVSVDSPDAVVNNWEAIKRAEKGEIQQASILDGISKSQPALSRALETSQKAVKVGFEWPNLDSLWECVMSEYQEFRAEMDALPSDQTVSAEAFERLESEMGDIYFASVNLARHFKIDPEVALSKATAKFTKRFQAMEALIRERFPQAESPEAAMAALDFETWDALWREAKQTTSLL